MLALRRVASSPFHLVLYIVTIRGVSDFAITLSQNTKIEKVYAVGKLSQKSFITAALIDVESLPLRRNVFSEVHYRFFHNAVVNLPSLVSLNLAFNGDLEDNTAVSKIGELLEGKGGSLELEDDDDDSDDGEGESGEEEEEGGEGKDRELNKTKVEEAIDQLADLTKSTRRYMCAMNFLWVFINNLVLTG
ncbi:hypothetical protein J3R30DRAFT_3694471 [Lentinula aciculospora]|uniref:Uncharacterized protein n=1 Tax=Lentinula aciculospora TaxID=153920 RepID=A0A9W9AWW6_9AGAR|nr:hypothetical protein J3R30DRAFT_3694471 [Lentinula aciculospora]